MFKPIEGYYSTAGVPLYDVSESGEVYSHVVKRLLTPFKDNKGYLQVALTNVKGITKFEKIHRLVALSHVERPVGCDKVIFKDLNKENVVAENLRWISSSELSSGRKVEWVKKRIRCSNGCEYDSAVQAASDTGCKTSNISMCCKGKLKQTKGLKFSFIID